MKHEEAANRLAELGNPTRLAIYRYLVKAGHEGLPVGHSDFHCGINPREDPI